MNMRGELLTAEDIEERLLETENKIKFLQNKNNSLLNLAASDPAYVNRTVNENDREAEKLRADLRAYETAIEYAD